jgi:hypothetical protein
MAFTELGVAHLSDKIGLDGFEEVALIAFQGTQVVILGVNNELTGFFGDIVKSSVRQEIKRRPAVGLTRCCHRREYHR